MICFGRFVMAAIIADLNFGISSCSSAAQVVASAGTEICSDSVHPRIDTASQDVWTCRCSSFLKASQCLGEPVEQIFAIVMEYCWFLDGLKMEGLEGAEFQSGKCRRCWKVVQDVG